MPAPRTRAVEPGRMPALFAAWIATDSGSSKAAASKKMWSGSLWMGHLGRSRALMARDRLTDGTIRQDDLSSPATCLGNQERSSHCS